MSKRIRHADLLVLDDHDLEAAYRGVPDDQLDRPIRPLRAVRPLARPPSMSDLLAKVGVRVPERPTVQRPAMRKVALAPGGEPLVLSPCDNVVEDEVLRLMRFDACNPISYSGYGGYGDEVQYGTVALRASNGASQYHDDSTLALCIGAPPPAVSLAIELFLNAHAPAGGGDTEIHVGVPTTATFQVPAFTRTSVAIFLPTATTRPPGLMTLYVRASATAFISRAVIRRVT